MTSRQQQDTEAAERLTRALIEMASNGKRPRCGDPGTRGLWLSDAVADRETAASWCAGCPVLGPCHDAGQAESFGVWGAVDRSPKPWSARKAAA